MKLLKAVLFIALLFVLLLSGALAQATSTNIVNFVSASYSSDEPKIVVGIGTFSLFDKLEYSLERTSPDCFDAESVKVSNVSVPFDVIFVNDPNFFGFLYTFEVPTTNYGAFDLSITGTKNGQSEAIDQTVYVEIVNDYDPLIGVGTDQIFFGDTDPAFVDIVLNLKEPTDWLNYKIEALGETDRLWCDSQGQKITVKNAVNVFNKVNNRVGEDDSVPLEGTKIPPDQSNSKYRLFLPDLSFDNSLFLFFKVTVNKVVRNANGQLEVTDEVLHEKEHLVMNCLSEEFPEGLDCSEYNDIGR